MDSYGFIISLVLSLLILAATVFLCSTLVYRRAKHKGQLKAFDTPIFQVGIVGVFLAIVILCIPSVYTVFDDLGIIERIVATVMMAVIRTLQFFVLDGDYEFIVESVKGLGEGLVAIYSSYGYVLQLLAPILSAGVLFSFINSAKCFIKYTFLKKSDIHFISELNERSLALAMDIFESATKECPKSVVFCSVNEDKEEQKALIEEAKELGAILLKKPIADIGFKPGKKDTVRKIYLMNDNEDENLKNGLILVTRFRGIQKFNTPKTEFYIFCHNFESEALIDSIDNGNMKVRRVDEKRNFALSFIREHSIFKGAIERDGKKYISILCVGLGKFGTELLKTISWAGQMYGYVLNIHVLDVLDDCARYISRFSPELIAYNGKEIKGEPYYNITFHNKMDVRQPEFLDEISSIKDITMAVVMLGNDELNIETAMRIRMQLGRDEIKWGRTVPEIYAVVYSDIKTDIISASGGLKSIKGVDYGISFFGDLRSMYALEVIEQKTIDKMGLECHLKWSKTNEEREEAIALYDRYEYYRRASYAEALHTLLREDLGLVLGTEGGVLDEEIVENEHKRWSAFMRAEGYVGSSKKDNIAKTHTDLVPFDELDAPTADKDRIVLTDA